MNEIYELLKRAGHSPAKALEITLDVQRGDRHAWHWVDAIRTELANIERVDCKKK